jgi:hypothetical protein
VADDLWAVVPPERRKQTGKLVRVHLTIAVLVDFLNGI